MFNKHFCIININNVYNIVTIINPNLNYFIMLKYIIYYYII